MLLLHVPCNNQPPRGVRHHLLGFDKSSTAVKCTEAKGPYDSVQFGTVLCVVDAVWAAAAVFVKVMTKIRYWTKRGRCVRLTLGGSELSIRVNGVEVKGS